MRRELARKPRSKPARQCDSTQARPSKMPSIRRLRRGSPEEVCTTKEIRGAEVNVLSLYGRAGTAASALAIVRGASESRRSVLTTAVTSLIHRSERIAAAGPRAPALGHHRRPAIKRCRSASEKGANEFGAHDRAPGTHAVNLRTKKSILASAALAGLDFGVHAAGYCETRAFKSICTSAYLSSQTSSMRHPLTMLLNITVSPCPRGCQHVAPRP